MILSELLGLGHMVGEAIELLGPHRMLMRLVEIEKASVQDRVGGHGLLQLPNDVADVACIDISNNRHQSVWETDTGATILRHVAEIR